MSVLAQVENPLQVALVRLRLENTPFRVVTRADIEQRNGINHRLPMVVTLLGGEQPAAVWKLHEESCTVFCRTSMQVGERVPVDRLTATVECGYILQDGIERRLRPEDGALFDAAMSLRAVTWFSSGGPGGGI